MAKDYQKELDALPEIKHLKSAIDQLQSDLTQGGLPFDTRQQLIHRLFRFDMVIGAVMTCDSIVKLQLNALTDDDRELHDQLEWAITYFREESERLIGLAIENLRQAVPPRHETDRPRRSGL
jgi:hypothetical protein